jgi:hypothetical protein
MSIHTSFNQYTWGEEGGRELDIYRQQELNPLQAIFKYIYKASSDDVEDIPIQIYPYFYTMSPSSQHLQ